MSQSQGDIAADDVETMNAESVAAAAHRPASTYSITVGHRARTQGKVKVKWFLCLALIVTLLGATRRRLTLPFPSPSSSSAVACSKETRSQWDALPSKYVICSPDEQRSFLMARRPDGDTSARIFTGQDSLGKAGYVSCLAVSDGIIAAVGSEDQVLQAACGGPPQQPAQPPSHRRKGLPRTNKSERLQRQRRFSLSKLDTGSCDVRRLRHGQTLFPGFQDAHGHIMMYGQSRTAVDLVGSKSKEEVVKRIEDFVRASPELLGYSLSAENGNGDDDVRWIEGLGWDQTKWDEPVFPTAADLSSSMLLRRFAISLKRVDVHALWLSEVALKLVEDRAQGFPQTPADDHSIDGCLVLRDARGRPTGILIDNAMNLANQVIPAWTFEQRKKYLEVAAEGLLRSGITAVVDAATDLESVNFYKRMDEEGALPLRIYSFLACPPDQRRCADRVDKILPTATSRFTLRSVMLFADGALGSWGSAIWDDYSDKAGECGLLLIREEEIEPLIRYWMGRGWQVGTHAIGDKANTLVLDAYESILRSGALPPSSDPRPRVEHAQIMRLSDAARFGELGVIASVQPTHCTSDMGYVESRIGPERAHGAYVWKTLLDSNARLALGSDFPVELPDPLHGMYSAISRLDPDGNSPSGRDGWYPNERVTRREALRGFTLDTSYAQFEEERASTLEVGKRADFTVLDRDILDEETVSIAALRAAHVEATLIDGKLAYDRAKDKGSRLAPAVPRPAHTSDSKGRLAREMAEDLVAQLQAMWYGHSPWLLSIATSLALIAIVLSRRGEDPYSNLSAMALNTRRPTTEWMNMGFWRNTTDFSTAAQQLAELLYTAAGVTRGSRILDVGCGTGESVLLLERTYSPRTLHAVTYIERDVARARRRLEAMLDREKGRHHRIWCGDITEWLVETSEEATEEGADAKQESKYDYILALDCAFHFKSRSDFLRLAHRRLAPGGTLALVDLLSAWPPVGRSGSESKEARAWSYTASETLADPAHPPTPLAKLRHAMTCKLLGVSPLALWSPDRYAAELMQAGFAASTASIHDISDEVFPPFARFLQGLGKEEEGAWRGGGMGMLTALRSFGGVVERWARGGEEGLVRCDVVVARKSEGSPRANVKEKLATNE